MKTAEINTFQMRIPGEINRQIKSTAAVIGVTKHDWIMKAIREQLKKEGE